MPRYQSVNYTQVAMMIRVAAMMSGERRLSVLVSDMSRKLSLGIDTNRVAAALGSKVVEKVEDYLDKDGFPVRKVTTLVVA